MEGMELFTATATGIDLANKRNMSLERVAQEAAQLEQAVQQIAESRLRQQDMEWKIRVENPLNATLKLEQIKNQRVSRYVQLQNLRWQMMKDSLGKLASLEEQLNSIDAGVITRHYMSSEPLMPLTDQPGFPILQQDVTNAASAQQVVMSVASLPQQRVFRNPPPEEAGPTVDSTSRDDRADQARSQEKTSGSNNELSEIQAVQQPVSSTNTGPDITTIQDRGYNPKQVLISLAEMLPDSVAGRLIRHTASKLSDSVIQVPLAPPQGPIEIEVDDALRKAEAPVVNLESTMEQVSEVLVRDIIGIVRDQRNIKFFTNVMKSTGESEKEDATRQKLSSDIAADIKHVNDALFLIYNKVSQVIAEGINDNEAKKQFDRAAYDALQSVLITTKATIFSEYIKQIAPMGVINALSNNKEAMLRTMMAMHNFAGNRNTIDPETIKRVVSAKNLNQFIEALEGEQPEKDHLSNLRRLRDMYKIAKEVDPELLIYIGNEITETFKEIYPQQNQEFIPAQLPVQIDRPKDVPKNQSEFFLKMATTPTVSLYELLKKSEEYNNQVKNIDYNAMYNAVMAFNEQAEKFIENLSDQRIPRQSRKELEQLVELRKRIVVPFINETKRIFAQTGHSPSNLEGYMAGLKKMNNDPELRMRFNILLERTVAEIDKRNGRVIGADGKRIKLAQFAKQQIEEMRPTSQRFRSETGAIRQ